MTRRRNNTEDNDHITHPWGIYSLEGFDNTRTIVSSLKCCLVSYQCPLISMRETTNQNYLLQTDGATKFCYPNLPFETLIQKWCKVSQYILATVFDTEEKQSSASLPGSWALLFPRQSCFSSVSKTVVWKKPHERINNNEIHKHDIQNDRQYSEDC